MQLAFSSSSSSSSVSVFGNYCNHLMHDSYIVCFCTVSCSHFLSGRVRALNHLAVCNVLNRYVFPFLDEEDVLWNKYFSSLCMQTNRINGCVYGLHKGERTGTLLIKLTHKTASHRLETRKSF